MKKYSLTKKLLRTSWAKEGLLESSDSGFLRAFEVEPKSSGDLEWNFEGPQSDGFYQKLSELLTRLPNLFEGQVILFRSKVEGEIAGLRTTILFIERIKKEDAYSHLGAVLSELKFDFEPLSENTWNQYCGTIFGASISGDRLPDIIWEEDHIRTGEQSVRMLSLTELPQVTWQGCFQAVFENPSAYALSLKFQIPDRKKIRRQLETKRRVSHALSVTSSLEVRNIESNSVLHSSEETLERILVNKETLFEVSLAVAVCGTKEGTLSLSHELERVVSGVGNAGLYREEIGSLPVFESHLPGTKALSIRKLPILSENLSQIFPLIQDFSRVNDPSALQLRSRTNELSHLNFFSASNINFNAFLAGASGSGKSYLMNAIFSSLLKDDPGTRIAIFDQGGSYRKLVEATGGRSEKLTPQRARDLISTFIRTTPVHLNGIFRILLESLCGSGQHITHSHSVAIDELLGEFEGERLQFSEFIEKAKARPEKYYQELAHWLKPHKKLDLDSNASELDGLFDSQVTAFDFKNLNEDPILQKTTIFLLSELLWKDLEKGKYSRTLVVFDEVWKFFIRNKAFLEEFYRTIRKYRGGICSITQNAADYGDDSFAKMIFSTSNTKIFLQDGASEDYLRNNLGVSESDARRAASVRSEKPYFSEFFVLTPMMSQIMRLYSTKEFYELANTENISKGA